MKLYVKIIELKLRPAWNDIALRYNILGGDGLVLHMVSDLIKPPSKKIYPTNDEVMNFIQDKQKFESVVRDEIMNHIDNKLNFYKRVVDKERVQNVLDELKEELGFAFEVDLNKKEVMEALKIK